LNLNLNPFRVKIDIFEFKFDNIRFFEAEIGNVWGFFANRCRQCPTNSTSLNYSQLPFAFASFLSIFVEIHSAFTHLYILRQLTTPFPQQEKNGCYKNVRTRIASYQQWFPNCREFHFGFFAIIWGGTCVCWKCERICACFGIQNVLWNVM
jgi:hypothetical protein